MHAKAYSLIPTPTPCMNSLSTEYCVGETVLCRRDRRRFLPTHDYSSGEWDSR